MKFHSLMAAALLSFATSSHAALIHQYELNGSLADKKGGNALVALGGTLGATGYGFGDNKGLELQYALGGVYTIDMSFRFDAFYSYNRILDFKNNTTDNGLYTHGDRFALYPTRTEGGNMDAGKYARVTITRDASKQLKIYQDGVLALSVLDDAGHADFGANYAYFFRDDNRDTGANESPGGAVDFINVYDQALSAAEVNALTVEPVSEPASLGLLGAGLALLGWTRRRSAPAAE